MDEFKKYLIRNQEELDSDEPSSLVWSKVQDRLKTLDQSASANREATAKVFSIRRWVQWSAAACILGLAGVGIWHLYTNTNSVKPLQEQVGTNDQDGHTAPNNIPIQTPANSTSNSHLKESVATTVPDSKDAAGGFTQPELSKTATSMQPRTNVMATASNNNTSAMNAFSNMESGFTQIINLQKGKISTTPMYAESASYFNEFKAQINQIEQEEKQIKKEIAKKGLTDHQLDQLINLYQYKLTVLKQLQLEMNKTNNRYKQNRGPVDSTRAYFINI